ncbi:adhesion G-protein coupled receptor G2 [Channa argus]|uniref:adhesion G-protein coupled receptor G2 n=1 Tax=Channa argus TaxID=215402 RepID=UPI002944A468|nr:hypothetical protein Q8A73_023410 [Channa argus]
MKALCICSDGPSCRRMFAASVREKKLGSLGIHLLWLQTLLVILLAGQAFCDQTSAAPTPPLTLRTTTAQTSVQYFIGITVNVTGQKMEESEIKAWLTNVFQNKLESCVSPSFQTTTATPNYTQTTAANISNETTLMTTKPSALESNNTTVATTATTLESNSTTEASTTTALQSNNTTAATTATTLEGNNTTIATTPTTLENNKTTVTTITTLENNNTTIATTPTTLENNKTTVTTITTLENNNTTIATTPTTLENKNTTIATTPTTLENNKTTVNTITTLENKNTTIATTPTTLENNKTTVTTITTLENNNTTIATTPTTLENNKTTVTTITTLENNNTTIATTPTTLENKNTTIATTPTTLENNKTTVNTITTLENKNTTIATTPTTLEINKTTVTTITTLENNNTTIATTVITLENNNTTEATTATTLESNNKTTATTALDNSKTTEATTAKTTKTSQSSNTKTTSTLDNSSTTTATKATTSKSSSGSPATPKTTTFNSNNPSAATTAQLTRAAPTQNTAFSTIVIPQTPNNGGNSNPSVKRLVRAVDSVTQSSGIGNNTITGLFQSIEVSCTVNTSNINTECSVRLKLEQTVPACCILRTLCAASETNIHVVGTKAYKDLPQNECDNNTQEESSCTYTGPVTESCDESGYVPGQINSTNCGAVTGNNTCSCSAYCNRTDTYYTFQISVNNFELNMTYFSSLISEKLKQAPNCTQSANVSCPLSAVAVYYKAASLTCGSIVTNHQDCSAILGFSNEVSTCDVAGAMIDVFQSQNHISYDGSVTRAAICGNSDLSIISPSPKFTSVKLMPSKFCMAIQASNNFTCNNGENLIVQLEDQCVQKATTTPNPNATTIQPNTTISTVNVTLSLLNTTANPLNATVNTSSTPVNESVSGTPSRNTTTNETAVNQANALLELTRDISKLNSSQVDQLVSKLQSLLSGPNVSLALGNVSVNIVSNLLGASPETLAHSSNNIIGIVDTVGLKLVLDNKAETLLAPAVALYVKPADGSNFQETFFSISNANNVQVRGNARLRKSLTTDSSTPQGSIMLPPSLTQGLTPEQQQLANRVQFNFYQKSTVFQDRSLGQRKLNSGILGASVANLSITGLKNNVVITLRNTEPVPANFVVTCVFWDFTLNNGSGGWNPAGCFVQNSTDSETVCGCNHLTSFAILLDLSRQPIISPLQGTILTFITYIGCGISAIFLSVTLLTYLAFEKLRKDIPSKILIQLCFSLLLLNLVFLVDAWLALYPNAVGLCISTAWFLHYFLLVSFTWMGLEAVHMYNAVVKVFNNHISCYMLKFSVVGWGVPMIVVIIVIAIDKNNYGLVSYGRFTDGHSDDFCWLRNDIAFYVAVVAYFCIIFLFNLIMFIVVLVQLCRIKKQNPHNVQHRSKLENVRSVAGLTILLSLTWGFAFFAWGPVNLAFTYLFTIFNSLQGFFLFVFYCAVKENVRRQWRAYLCCGKMRLAENSEWSRTATQKTMKRSSSNQLTTLHSLQSNTSSSSSFLVTNSSEQINGIRSPMEDRAITADENSRRDVILNEINSQHRNQQAL